MKLKIAITLYAKERNMTISDLAKRIGLSKSTMYQRMNNPQEFTIDELKKIKKVLSIKKDEFTEMIGELI